MSTSSSLRIVSSSFVPLTALWAFVESGLGGLMHALHIPLTGIVLGGFSVLIIGLLASLSERPWQEILSATSIVIIIKAMVNPATPPMAYMAVAYQGLSGALLFGWFAHHRITCILYAVLAMLESAGQKLLIITLVFGKTLWEGIDALGDSAIKFFFLPADFSLSKTLLVTYLGIYFLWGWLLGHWLYVLPKQLHIRKEWYHHWKPAEGFLGKEDNSSGKKNISTILLLIIAMLSIYILWIKGGLPDGSAYLLRTCMIIAVWLLVIMPVIRKMILRWVAKQKQSQPKFNSVFVSMQQIRTIASPLYLEMGKRYTGIKRWKEYILALIIISLSLYSDE